MRLVAGVVRVTADLERIVKYAFRISPMLGSCSFDFGIWIVAPSVSKMSRSQLNYAASPGGFVTSTNLISCVLIRRSSPSVQPRPSFSSGIERCTGGGLDSPAGLARGTDHCGTYLAGGLVRRVRCSCATYFIRCDYALGPVLLTAHPGEEHSPSSMHGQHSPPVAGRRCNKDS